MKKEMENRKLPNYVGQPIFRPLNTSKQATKTLLKYIPQTKLERLHSTYYFLKYLLSKFPPLPFPLHITRQIVHLLNRLYFLGLLTGKDIQDIQALINKKIDARIKKYLSENNRKARKSLKPQLKACFKCRYPEAAISDAYPMDFYIYCLAISIKKRLNLHEDGYDKWGLIEDFLNEQGIRHNEQSINTVRMRYDRSRQYIQTAYNYIYDYFPHDVLYLPFRKLPKWTELDL